MEATKVCPACSRPRRGWIGRAQRVAIKNASTKAAPRSEATWRIARNLASSAARQTAGPTVVCIAVLIRSLIAVYDRMVRQRQSADVLADMTIARRWLARRSVPRSREGTRHDHLMTLVSAGLISLRRLRGTWHSV